MPALYTLQNWQQALGLVQQLADAVGARDTQAMFRVAEDIRRDCKHLLVDDETIMTNATWHSMTTTKVGWI